MLNKMWKSTLPSQQEARLFEYMDGKGNITYSFRNHLGYPSNVDKDEVDIFKKNFKLVLVQDNTDDNILKLPFDVMVNFL